eukprot:CAMPEP_0179317082 /NCGR_PEP_ID=MMETSP0797-20121207/56059_1 /TAXON_ID=47934 /ORGANISM="Dinophysis acuminata, Strain DAEP01" /LENGTH=197 /DNA_ID=CAMNT_0021027957 /DNA_START=1 /DNA_END=594 /DNA_ORIENTATION=+
MRKEPEESGTPPWLSLHAAHGELDPVSREGSERPPARTPLGGTRNTGSDDDEARSWTSSQRSGSTGSSRSASRGSDGSKSERRDSKASAASRSSFAGTGEEPDEDREDAPLDGGADHGEYSFESSFEAATPENSVAHENSVAQKRAPLAGIFEEHSTAFEGGTDDDDGFEVSPKGSKTFGASNTLESSGYGSFEQDD